MAEAWKPHPGSCKINIEWWYYQSKSSTIGITQLACIKWILRTCDDFFWTESKLPCLCLSCVISFCFPQTSPATLYHPTSQLFQTSFYSSNSQYLNCISEPTCSISRQKTLASFLYSTFYATLRNQIRENFIQIYHLVSGFAIHVIYCFSKFKHCNSPCIFLKLNPLPKLPCGMSLNLYTPFSIPPPSQQNTLRKMWFNYRSTQQMSLDAHCFGKLSVFV